MGADRNERRTRPNTVIEIVARSVTFLYNNNLHKIPQPQTP
jgi:hypothetical protein